MQYKNWGIENIVYWFHIIMGESFVDSTWESFPISNFEDRQWKTLIKKNGRERKFKRECLYRKEKTETYVALFLF